MTPKTVIRAGYGRSFDLGVFGSTFGHVVTQNIPVLANQSLSGTAGTTSYAFNLSDPTNTSCSGHRQARKRDQSTGELYTARRELRRPDPDY